jgi:hypothetical protein
MKLHPSQLRYEIWAVFDTWDKQFVFAGVGRPSEYELQQKHLSYVRVTELTNDAPILPIPKRGSVWRSVLVGDVWITPSSELYEDACKGNTAKVLAALRILEQKNKDLITHYDRALSKENT